MAIIKLTGKDDGIVTYLKTGNKSGRTKGRNEIDQRVVLKGNIELLDEIIKSNNFTRVKYVHITISFLEDYVDVKTLMETLKYYENDIFTAFREDEYYLYAEAHLPKDKTFIDEKGETRYRKPHIHIVVPNINLKTGAAVNPWGMYTHNQKYFNAIQESINSRTGSTSPSQRRRNNFTSRSSILEREKGDTFRGEISKFKRDLLDKILEKNISTAHDFRRLLSNFGEHKTRNEGNDNSYETIKPKGSTQFINLRDFLFSKDFFSLTLQEKRKILEPKSEGEFFSLGVPRDIPDDVDKILDEWRRLRSRQIKYINGNASNRYKRMSHSEKIEFLDELEKKYFQKLDTPMREALAPTSLDDIKKFIRKKSSATDQEHGVSNTSDSFLTQLIRDRKDTAWVRSPEIDALVRELNSTINIDFMLADLVCNHGLVREKYQTCGQEKLGEAPIEHQRIRCGMHNLNVGDFLTRQMNMRWPDAFSYMQNIVIRQNTHIPNRDSSCGRPHPVVWSQFQQRIGQTRVELNQEYKQFIIALRTTITEEKSAAAVKRSYDRFALFQIKMPSYMRKLFLALIDAQYAGQESLMKESLLVQIKKSSSRKLRPSTWSLYLYFLHKSATASTACLNELRRHAPAHEKHLETLCFLGRADAAINDIGVIDEFNLTRRISVIGDVQYEKNGMWLARDEGEQIVVNAVAGSIAIRVANMLAKRKWITHSVEGPSRLLLAAKAIVAIPKTSSGRAEGDTNYQGRPSGHRN